MGEGGDELRGNDAQQKQGGGEQEVGKRGIFKTMGMTVLKKKKNKGNHLLPATSMEKEFKQIIGERGNIWSPQEKQKISR